MQKSCVVYYSSNRESSAFEQRVMDGISSVLGDIPLISVTQKPVKNFGTNICVGDVGNTYLNAFRQLLLGCEAVQSEFIITAEADCFYPKTGYFDFNPINPNVIYTYDNVWILWKGGRYFHHKEQTHASVIYGRDFLIDLLHKSLAGLPQWSREKVGFPFYTKDHEFIHFSGLPIVNVKTGAGVQKGTHLNLNMKPRKSLDGIGTVAEFKQRIFCE